MIDDERERERERAGAGEREASWVGKEGACGWLRGLIRVHVGAAVARYALYGCRERVFAS